MHQKEYPDNALNFYKHVYVFATIFILICKDKECKLSLKEKFLKYFNIESNLGTVDDQIDKLKMDLGSDEVDSSIFDRIKKDEITAEEILDWCEKNIEKHSE